MPLSRIRQLLAQLLSGLEEAHQLRIVHRDLKPSNVFLTADRAKILDFGIARQEGPDTGLTHTGEVLGSPKYMSPEQIQGEELDGRSDLYAVGVLTFVMLTGREPFVGKTPSAIALAQLREAPPDIGKLRPELAGRVARSAGAPAGEGPRASLRQRRGNAGGGFSVARRVGVCRRSRSGGVIGERSLVAGRRSLRFRRAPPRGARHTRFAERDGSLFSRRTGRPLSAKARRSAFRKPPRRRPPEP